MTSDWRRGLAEALPNSKVRLDAPLAPMTTLRIGGAADCFVDVGDEGDLERLFQWIRAHDLPWFLLGKGSNILVPDGGLRGVVMRLGAGFQIVDRQGELVRVGAGCPNAKLLQRCMGWGLGGLEFLIAVPGTVGGAVAMNAGAHQGETADFLESVRFFDAESGFREAPATEFSFAYRTSPLNARHGKWVVGATFRLEPRTPEQIKARMDQFQTYRRETQPRDFPNCGSVFKNPPGDFAARLIDQAGLKGLQKGHVQVSEKHANFIVNRGGASAREAMELIDMIKEKVYKEFGITLELELQLL